MDSPVDTCTNQQSITLEVHTPCEAPVATLLPALVTNQHRVPGTSTTACEGPPPAAAAAAAAATASAVTAEAVVKGLGLRLGLGV